MHRVRRAAVVSAACLLVAAPSAMAQLPTGPGVPGPAPGAPPADLAPATTTPVPSPTATPVVTASPVPTATATPVPTPTATPTPPRFKGVEIAVRSAKIVRGKLSLPLRCERSGSLTIRTSAGLKLGSTRFTCSRGVSVATARVPAKAARKVKGKRSVALRVTITMAGRKYVRTLTLGKPKPKASAAAGRYWIGGAGVCGSKYSPNVQSYSFSTPLLQSLSPYYSEWVWVKPWLLWYNNGHYQWSEFEWLSPLVGQPAGSIYVNSYTNVPLGRFDDFHHWWVAAAAQIYWQTSGIGDWNYLNTQSVFGGYMVINNWCLIG
jgi:hypothetical protein